MLRLTLKNLVANRLRFALTTFAVVLAVAFVVSSFVLTDGLRATFGDLSEEITAGVDLELRPTSDFGGPERLDESLLAAVDGTEGVASAAPLVEAPVNAIQPINADGEAIPSTGPPQLAFGWYEDEALSSFTLVEGEAPVAADELVMDVDAATKHGFDIGGTYDVITPTGRTELTLTGLVSFGQANDTAGATLMLLPIDSLQALTATDGYDSIVVSVDSGADVATVQAELEGLAAGTEVVDNATITSEQQAEFNEGINIVGTFLLGFAGVSLFVSIFIIYNTFSIVLGQRTSELALLRTVGADPAQLRRSVLAEAAAIGVLASAVGIGAGIGVAFGLRALFGAIGAELPDSPVVMSARTVVLALTVGIGVTLAAAIGPARKASRVPPIAALRDGAAAGAAGGRIRLAVGTVMLAVGSSALAFGLFAASGAAAVVSMLAIGAAGVFLGITMISPLLTGPLTGLLGWPIRRGAGVSGRLAQQNAGRNPHRTATTAAALMIGLALVSMALTVGQSIKAELRSTLASSVQADYLIDDASDGNGFPATLVDELVAAPVTDTIAGFRFDDARVAGDEDVIRVGATDLEAAAQLFDFEIVEGVPSDASVVDPVLISDSLAESGELSVGDRVPIEFTTGATRDLTVIGVYSDGVILDGEYLLDDSTWDAVGAEPGIRWLGLSLVDGVTVAQADEVFAPIAADYPQVNIDTSGEFVERLEGFVDSALTVVNAMVALAVIIALVGIANTLALSVFERTRELGLLRAVGMTRRQLRRMVRLEASLVALFGATLGVATGVAFGWAAVLALPESVTSTLSIPVLRIAVLVAVAAAAGLVAAWGPARRASRLDVLDAIAL